MKCELEKEGVKNQEILWTSFMDDPITSLHYVEPRNHAKNNKNLGKKTYDRATVIKNRKLQSKTKGRNQDPSCYLLTDFFQF